MNRQKHETASSKYKGVCYRKNRNKWEARVGLNRKITYLGLFSSEEDAARAYDKAAKGLFGEFAKLNFPV